MQEQYPAFSSEFGAQVLLCNMACSNKYNSLSVKTKNLEAALYPKTFLKRVKDVDLMTIPRYERK